jgi:hypothetical protein
MPAVLLWELPACSTLSRHTFHHLTPVYLLSTTAGRCLDHLTNDASNMQVCNWASRHADRACMAWDVWSLFDSSSTVSNSCSPG